MKVVSHITNLIVRGSQNRSPFLSLKSNFSPPTTLNIPKLSSPFPTSLPIKVPTYPTYPTYPNYQTLTQTRGFQINPKSLRSPFSTCPSFSSLKMTTGSIMMPQFTNMALLAKSKIKDSNRFFQQSFSTVDIISGVSLFLTLLVIFPEFALIFAFALIFYYFVFCVLMIIAIGINNYRKINKKNESD